jgi:hypothetical protein
MEPEQRALSVMIEDKIFIAVLSTTKITSLETDT